MLNKTVRALLMAVVFGCLFGAYAMPDSTHAARHMSMQDSSHQKIWAELNLTADQKVKLKTMREDAQQSRTAIFDKMKDLRDKSKQELLKEKPSKDVLYGYAKQLAEEQKILAEHMADHMLKLKSILTKEQFEKVLSKDFFMGMQKEHGGNGSGSDKKEHWHEKE
jgi:Spy/CpxP family protein refolding chaperone